MSKKKSPLRSEFTDALDEEISTRKILERAKLKESEPEPPKVIVETVEVAPPPVEEIPVPPRVEVPAETKLEERIIREADNDFFDEKPARKSEEGVKYGRQNPKSAYRSRALRRWEEDREDKNPPPNPIDSVKNTEPSRMSRTERAGVVISIVMLVYAFSALDKPLFFMALSLLVHCFRPLVGAISGRYSHDVQNAMRSFSIVLFFGAILFIFL